MVNSVIVENNAIDSYGSLKRNEVNSEKNTNSGLSDFQTVLSEKTKKKENNTKINETSDNSLDKKKDKKIAIIAGFVNQNHKLSSKLNVITKNKSKDGSDNLKKQINTNDKLTDKQTKTNLKLTNTLTYNNDKKTTKNATNLNSKDLLNQIIADKLSKLTNGKSQKLNIKEIKFEKSKIDLSNNWQSITIDSKNSKNAENIKSKHQKLLKFVNKNKENETTNAKSEEQKSAKITGEKLLSESNDLKSTKTVLSSSATQKEAKTNINNNMISNFDRQIEKSKFSENIRLMNNNGLNNQANGNKKQEVTGNNLYNKVVKNANFKNDKHLQNYLGDIKSIFSKEVISSDKSNTYEVKDFIKPTDIAKEIIKIGKNLTDNTSHSVRILLKPESLGTLFVKIQLVSNKVNVKLDVEQREVLKALESQVAVLKEGLEKVGLKTGDINYGLRENLEGEEKPDFQHREQKDKDNNFRKDFVKSFNLGEIELSLND